MFIKLKTKISDETYLQTSMIAGVAKEDENTSLIFMDGCDTRLTVYHPVAEVLGMIEKSEAEEKRKGGQINVRV